LIVIVNFYLMWRCRTFYKSIPIFLIQSKVHLHRPSTQETIAKSIADFVKSANNFLRDFRMFIIICVHHINLRYLRSIVLLMIAE